MDNSAHQYDSNDGFVSITGENLKTVVWKDEKMCKGIHLG